MLQKIRRRVVAALRPLIQKLVRLDKSPGMRRLFHRISYRFPGLGLRLRRFYLLLRTRVVTHPGSGKDVSAESFGVTYPLPEGRLAQQRTPLERHFRAYAGQCSSPGDPS